MQFKLYKVNSLPQKLIPGCVYFINSEKAIYVATSETAYTKFDSKLEEFGVIEYISYLTGNNTVTSATTVPIDKRLVICNLSSNNAFSLASVPEAGKEIHIIIHNTSSKSITISIPSNAPYINLGKDALTILAGKYLEINALSDGTNVYLRSI